MSLREYLIVGLWPEDGGRFAESVDAESPEQAEELILADHEGLQIAGVLTVVAGAIEVVA